MLSKAFPDRWTPYVLSIARTVIGFLLVQQGMIRLFGYPSGNHVSLVSISGAAGFVMFVGGILITLGIWTQRVSIVVALEMAASYLVNNLPVGFWTIRNGGDVTVLNCLFFLFLSTTDAGAWSVDRLLNRTNDSLISSKAPYILSILRIVVGFMFLQWGLQKSFGLIGGRVAHDFTGLLAWAGLIETIGAPLIMIGLFTRSVAFVLSGEMAVAYWTRWAPRGFWPSLDRTGALTVSYCFIFLFLCVASGGTWSLDNVLRRKRTAKASEMSLDGEAGRV